MRDDRDARLAGQHVRRIIFGAVVDDEHVLAVAADFGQHAGGVSRFVINGKRGETAKGAARNGAARKGATGTRAGSGLVGGFTWRVARKRFWRHASLVPFESPVEEKPSRSALWTVVACGNVV